MLAQTLNPNVNTCTGQPLTFAQSSCTVQLKCTSCLFLRPSSLFYLIVFFSASVLRPFLLSLISGVQPPERLNVELWDTVDKSPHFLLRLRFWWGRQRSFRRTVWFIRDKNFSETLIEFKIGMLSDWRLCLCSNSSVQVNSMDFFWCKTVTCCFSISSTSRGNSLTFYHHLFVSNPPLLYPLILCLPTT